MSAGTSNGSMPRRGLASSRPTKGGPDIFVHQSAVHAGGMRTLEEKARVKFDIAQGPKGPLATNLQKF